MEKKNEKQRHKKTVKSVKATGEKVIKSDVQGSYTGVPENPYEEPVQDVDDL